MELIVSIHVNGNQIFELKEDKPDHEKIIKDFNLIECILDPELPCKWSVTDLRVDSLEVEDDEVRREYSCVIHVQAEEHEIEKLKEFMMEEGYYDEDEDTFDWAQGINYFIADTTVCNENYASFSREDVTLDVIQLCGDEAT